MQISLRCVMVVHRRHPPFLQLELVQLAALPSHPVAGGFPGNRLHADDQGAGGEPEQKDKTAEKSDLLLVCIRN